MTAIQKLAANFTEADVDDEIILMRLDNGDLFALADTAAATWRLIDGRRDHRALVEALAQTMPPAIRKSRAMSANCWIS